jgi:methylenetetrahydrofolate reductase (NADPH)
MSKSTGPAIQSSRSSLSEAFRTLGYEVLPFKGTEDNVLENVPKEIRLTVTVTPTKGIDATVDLAVALAKAGYSVAPHLSARMIIDEKQLADILTRLTEAKVSQLFVVGGDFEQAGKFTDAFGLLQAIDAIGHDFTDIGIGGYPEGHGSIPDENLVSAMEQKAPYAKHITTQICFNAKTTIDWAQGLSARGINLPVRVGMPGAVSRQKLIRITGSLGLGQSARFLQKQQSMFWRFFLPGGYNPNKLAQGLKPALASQDSTIQGFHIFTFNELKGTEEWRRNMIERFAGA